MARGISAQGIAAGDDRADAHDADPDSSPAFSQHSRRCAKGRIELGGEWMFSDELLVSVADIGVDLPGTAEHEHVPPAVAQVGRVVSHLTMADVYGLATASSASSRRSASSMSISPRSTASRTARRLVMSWVVADLTSGLALVPAC